MLPDPTDTSTSWKAELAPDRLITSLTAGLIAGVLTITMGTAFSALIFSGPLSGFVSQGISLILCGACIIGALVALTSSYAGTVARPHEIPAAILALIASIIAGSMGSAPGADVFITVVTTMIVTSVATGLFFLCLGYLKAGNLIRFIPYPVIGGFVAGSGWLLITGAFRVMTEKTLTLPNLFYLAQPEVLLKWLPGVFLALVLFVILRWRNHYLVMPAWLLASLGLFYLALLLTNTPLTEVRSQGWLIGPFKEGVFQHPFAVSSSAHTDWGLILGQSGRLGTILIVSCISLLINASGLEIVVREEIDLNQELRSVGFGNLLSGLGGGIVGFHSLSLSALGYTMGAKSRLVGLFSAALCGSILLFGSALLSYFPRPVMGSILLFLGFSFLYEWLYETWFKLPKTDCLLIIVILVVIGVFGFLEGVGVGLLVAALIFVIKYSHVSVIKHVLSGVNYHSNVDRASAEKHALSKKGEGLYILKLQGFVFFGTAHNLHEQVRQRARDEALTPLGFVVLDFRLVNGVDSSAVNSFAKMRRHAEAQDYVLLLTQLSPDLLTQFMKGGFRFEEDEHFRVFPDLDHGVEWCEDEMLVEAGAPARQTEGLERHLGTAFLRPADVGRFMTYLERREVPKGYYLMAQGDPPHSLYFLESGQVTVQLQNEFGQTVRLRTMGAGTVVGELGLYLKIPSTASVITEKPSTFYRLTAEALQQMEQREPEIASAFHRFMVSRLGERLVDTNQSLKALMD